jgi:modification methylase
MATVKKVKLSDIEPDLLNANRHTERGNVMLRQSMEQFGFAEAGTLDKNNRIIGGNHRTEVSADVLAADEAIIIEVDGHQPVFIKRNDLDLSTDEGRQLSYYLNRSAQVSIDFDPERILADIEAGVELGDLFREDELKEILGELGREEPEDPEPPDISKADELQEKWGTEVGQIWQLGEHRLACGDCTDRAVVEGVMREEWADLIFTSPPYNRGITTGGGFPDKGGLWEGAELASGYNSYDDAMPLEDYRNWQKELLLFWWDLLASDGAIYYNHRPRVQNGLLETPLDWNPALPLRQIIIWHSGSGINFAPTHYRPACEWIVIYAKADFRLSSKGVSGIGDVWKFGSEMDNSHPAPFPLELPFTAIQTSGAAIILDPFLGSGTTLIACENLARRCRGIEIDPGYVAVSIQRWVDLTNGKPELIS